MVITMHTVPKSKHFRLNDKPIVAVKFFPSVTLTVKDQDYIREEAKKKMDQRLLDKKLKEIYDLEQAMEQGEPAPVKEISTKEIWHAWTNDGKFFSVEEDILVQKFGAAYVKKSRRAGEALLIYQLVIIRNHMCTDFLIY